MGRNYKDVKGKNNPNFKGGHTMGKMGFYNSWCNMKQRCRNPNHPKYDRYGGRGISVCKEWDDIQVFADWAIENGWKKGLSIDRIDNDGSYCPENCRWVSMSKNSRKKSTTKLTFRQAEDIRKRHKDGECLYNMAKEYGVVHGTLWFIVKNFTHVPEGECSRAMADRDRKNSINRGEENAR